MKIKYTLGELVELSRVPERTVYFYIQQRILKPPVKRPSSEGMQEDGERGKRFTDDHLWTLHLIGKLQNIRPADGRMTLGRIGGIIGGLTGEEKHSLLGCYESDPEGDPLVTLSRWFAEHRPHTPAVNQLIAPESVAQNTGIRNSFPTRSKRAEPRTQETEWHRIRLSDGIELHVRKDKYDQLEKKLKQVREELGIKN